MQQIRRSKLEMYVDILKVLANNGQLMQANIMSKVNFNCNMLKEHLSFLVKHELVEEQTIKKRKTAFDVTQKGISVLRYFKELEQKPSITE